MDFIKKILSFLQDKTDYNGLVTFNHQVAEDGSPRIITIHTDGEGMIIMTIFTPEEWQMVIDVAELTSESIIQIVTQIAEDNNVATITFDPKDFH